MFLSIFLFISSLACSMYFLDRNRMFWLWISMIGAIASIINIALQIR